MRPGEASPYLTSPLFPPRPHPSTEASPSITSTSWHTGRRKASSSPHMKKRSSSATSPWLVDRRGHRVQQDKWRWSRQREDPAQHKTTANLEPDLVGSGTSRPRQRGTRPQLMMWLSVALLDGRCTVALMHRRQTAGTTNTKELPAGSGISSPQPLSQGGGQEPPWRFDHRWVTRRYL